MNVRKTVTAAALAALVCVATLLIQIHIPATGGYVNFGDCFIIAGAWLIGGGWGFAAAGLGSALADIFAGYAVFAPGTFFIKGLMAVTAAAVLLLFKKHQSAGRIVSSLAAETVMIVGYFAYEWLFITGSAATAAAGMIGNLVQGAFGAAGAFLLYLMLEKTKAVRLIKQ